MSQTIFKIFRSIKIFCQKLQEDHITAYSAMSAYFLLMSFIPFLMILLMLAKYLPFSEKDILNLLNSSTLVNENVFLQTILEEVFHQNNVTILGITIFFLLWSASKSVWGFMKGLNSVFDAKDVRGNMTLRLTAVLYTITVLFLIASILIILVFGSKIYNYILLYYPVLSPILSFLFKARRIVSIFILTGFFLLLYMHIPRITSTLRSQIIGAIFTSCSWTLYAFFFSVYVNHFSNYTKLYGGLGAVLIFFLWLYMLMYLLFLGAEINFIFSPAGKLYYSSYNENTICTIFTHKK